MKPPPALSEDNIRDARKLMLLGNAWAVVQPNGASAQEQPLGPGEHWTYSDYFAGLPPNKTLRFYLTGDRTATWAKRSAAELKGYEGLEPVRVGPFSDHCLAVGKGDPEIQFSVLLGESVALQTVVTRSGEVVKATERDSEDYRPITQFEVRTVDLNAGKVIGRSQLRMTGQRIDAAATFIRPLATEGVALVVWSTEPRALFTIKRSGEVVATHTLPCARPEFALSREGAGAGSFRLSFPSRQPRVEPCEVDLEISADLTVRKP